MIRSVCIVGNGPSATNKAAAIDACDFVVRMKAFWAHGPENAGNKINALCWYGGKNGWEQHPDLRCEHWCTQEPGLLYLDCEHQSGVERLEFFVAKAWLRPIRWVPREMWLGLAEYLGSAPTTGFTAIAMALVLFRPPELHLYGYDATTADKPNYHDARREIPREEAACHNVAREKQVIAEMLGGKWLGVPCETRLVWHEMPEV